MPSTARPATPSSHSGPTSQLAPRPRDASRKHVMAARHGTADKPRHGLKNPSGELAALPDPATILPVIFAARYLPVAAISPQRSCSCCRHQMVNNRRILSITDFWDVSFSF